VPVEEPSTASTTDMEDNVVPQVLIRLIGTDRRD
jgi:hypothetical protein